MKSYEFKSLDSLLAYVSNLYGKSRLDNLKNSFRLIDLSLTTPFWLKTIHSIKASALEFYELFPSGIPILKEGIEDEISFTRRQCKCIMANFFFCTFDDRPRFNLGDINFIGLYIGGGVGAPVKKLRLLLSYFLRAYENAENDSLVVTFRRYVLKEKVSWHTTDTLLTDVDIHEYGTIEDEGLDCIQVDFANKMIGGGVLRRGAVQEEIRFCINPELFISKLIIQKLSDLESVSIIGTERFTNYSGYAKTLEYHSEHYDKIEVDEKNRKKTWITAIDAIHFYDSKSQFTPALIKREIEKAYIGFLCIDPCKYTTTMPIATGHWGCGAFRGDKELKFLIQIIAASQANRSLRYFTFGDSSAEMSNIYQMLTMKKVKVSQLYQALMNFNKYKKVGVFDHIKNWFKN